MIGSLNLRSRLLLKSLEGPDPRLNIKQLPVTAKREALLNFCCKIATIIVADWKLQVPTLLDLLETHFSWERGRIGLISCTIHAYYLRTTPCHVTIIVADWKLQVLTLLDLLETHFSCERGRIGLISCTIHAYYLRTTPCHVTIIVADCKLQILALLDLLETVVWEQYCMLTDTNVHIYWHPQLDVEGNHTAKCKV